MQMFLVKLREWSCQIRNCTSSGDHQAENWHVSCQHASCVLFQCILWVVKNSGV